MESLFLQLMSNYDIDTFLTIGEFAQDAWSRTIQPPNYMVSAHDTVKLPAFYNTRRILKSLFRSCFWDNRVRQEPKRIEPARDELLITLKIYKHRTVQFTMSKFDSMELLHSFVYNYVCSEPNVRHYENNYYLTFGMRPIPRRGILADFQFELARNTIIVHPRLLGGNPLNRFSIIMKQALPSITKPFKILHSNDKVIPVHRNCTTCTNIILIKLKFNDRTVTFPMCRFESTQTLYDTAYNYTL
jgi:hypothetical protein